MNVKEDEYFLDYVELRGLRDTTVRVQALSMGQYCELIGKTPTELVQEARAEQRDIPWVNERKIKTYLVKFLRFMRNNDLAYSSIVTRMGHIRSFYIEYEIQLPKVRLNTAKKESKQVTHKDIPGRDDIAYALQFCSLKLRAIVMLMASSGMAHVDVRHLTIEDFYRSIDIDFKLPVDIETLESFVNENKHYCPVFQKNRIKSGVPFTTFCTPETLKVIVDYIRTREKPYQSGDDTLFGYESQQGGNSLENMIRRVNDKAGFGWKGTSRFFTAHKMRKYFTTTLYSNNVPELSIHWYLGHRVPKSTDAYFKANLKTHRKEYERMVPDLTFTENVKTRILESEEFRKLKKDYEKGFKEKDEEIAAMEKRMELMDKKAKETEDLKAELEDVKSKLAELGPLAKAIGKPKVRKLLESEIDQN